MIWQRTVVVVAFMLGACGSPEEEARPKGTEPDVTDTDTTDTTDTDTTDTDTTNTEPAVAFASPDVETSPAVLTGVVAQCDEGEVHLIGEFMGPIGTVTVAAIVDGALREPVELAIEERSLFHRGEGTLSVDDCEAIGWRFVAAANGHEHCMVTGSGAQTWLDASGDDCELR